VVRATRADNDEQLLQSWLKSLSSPHTQRNFETTARRVLAELPMGLRVFWPAFRKIDFLRAVRAFQQRHRRLGR